jgi:hypothetical protein
VKKADPFFVGIVDGRIKNLEKKKKETLTKRQLCSPFTLCSNNEGLGVGPYKTKEGDMLSFSFFLCFFCSFQRRMETQKRRVGASIRGKERERERKGLVADTRQ